MFGDNESVVTNATIPHSTLKKRHIALSYHRVREAIASDAICFAHLPGALNPADILSKHWGHQQVWTLLRPLLFWYGDTNCIPDDGKGSEKVSVDSDAKPTEVGAPIDVGISVGKEPGDEQTTTVLEPEASAEPVHGTTSKELVHGSAPMETQEANDGWKFGEESEPPAGDKTTANDTTMTKECVESAD
jgi:hypothetical protein